MGEKGTPGHARHGGAYVVVVPDEGVLVGPVLEGLLPGALGEVEAVRREGRVPARMADESPVEFAESGQVLASAWQQLTATASRGR